MKEKADSSMSKAISALKDGEAHAVVSPGNTGALFTSASLTVRRIKGIRRAALGAVLPLENPFLLLDSGANPSALPENLEWLFLRGHEEWFLEGGSPSALGTDEPRKETSCYKNTARQCDEHFYLQI